MTDVTDVTARDHGAAMASTAHPARRHPAGPRPGRLRGALAAVAVVACSAPLDMTHAQAFPAKPVRIVVGSSPGGGIDAIARLLGPRMAEQAGQPMVVENRPGAGTTLGAGVVAKSPADGYTIYVASTSFAVAPSLFKSLPYDTARDFAAVTLLAYSPMILAVHPGLPARTTQELIALAKAQPGKLKYGSAGSGSSVHLAGELLKLAGGVDLLHVPYKGSAPATTDLLAGHIDLIFGGIIEMLPQVKAGKLRALALTGRKRSALLPEVPTVLEANLNFEVGSWYGFVVPAGTPRDNVQRLHELTARALADPAVRERLASQATDVIADGPEKFGPYLQAEIGKWARVVQQAGITPE